jgi:Metal-dependent hydrolase
MYWGFLKKWKYTLVGIVTILICINPILRYTPFNSKSENVPKENTIKVLTYNIMFFAFQDHTKEKPNPIIEYIIKSDADIVCLQEFQASKSEQNLNLNKIKKALSIYPYSHIEFYADDASNKMGIAVFSKYKILKSRKIEYKSEGNGSTIHELKINDKTLTLVNNHLESFKLTMEDRSNYTKFIQKPGTDAFGDLRGSINNKIGPALMKRAKQAQIIRKEINNIESDYTIVCGDFNDTPISYVLRTIQGEDLKDAFVESGFGFGNTYNQNFFWFRIDHILYSPNMEAINCTVDKVEYSDHYPVLCYLKMN